MHEQVHCHDEAPVVHRSSLLHHPNSFREGMLKLNAKFDAHLLLYLLSHFECDGHREHMLTQWCLLSPLTSTVKLSLFTYAHSPWLPGYINVALAVLILLTMVGLFPNIVNLCVHICIYI